jgi:hypothetical protein
MPLYMDVHTIDGAVAVDTPSPDAANVVHREAHGLVADGLFDVREGL